jgi:hypothetical protein
VLQAHVAGSETVGGEGDCHHSHDLARLDVLTYAC